MDFNDFLQKDVDELKEKLKNIWGKNKDSPEISLILKETFENRRDDINKYKQRPMYNAIQDYPCLEKQKYVRDKNK